MLSTIDVVLIPIIAGIMSTIKRLFPNMKGKVTVIISWIVAILTGIVYALINKMVLWETALLGLMCGLGANLGMNLLKQIGKFFKK